MKNDTIIFKLLDEFEKLEEWVIENHSNNKYVMGIIDEINQIRDDSNRDIRIKLEQMKHKKDEQSIRCNDCGEQVKLSEFIVDDEKAKQYGENCTCFGHIITQDSYDRLKIKIDKTKDKNV